MRNNSGAKMRRLLLGVSMAALVAGGATSAFAADPDVKALKAEVAELKSELAELRALVAQTRNEQAGAVQAATDARATAVDAKTAVETLQLSDADNTAAITKLNAAPTLSVSNGRPTFSTADGRFSAALRSVIMFDSASYFQDDPKTPDLRRGAGTGDTARAQDLNSGTDFRRARLGVEGKVFGDYTYGFTLEFGGTGTEDPGRIHEAFVQYNGIKPLQIKVGAFEPQAGLSANVSTSSMMIMERPAPAEVARNVAAGDSRSAVQILANGDWGSDSALGAYWLAAGAVTGGQVSTISSSGGTTAQPFDEQEAVLGRFAVAPFHGTDWLAHIGVSGSYVYSLADTTGVPGASRYPVQFRDRPELRVDGTRLVDSGGINADNAYVLGLEGAFQMSNFLIQGEAFRYGAERRAPTTLSDPEFDGYYVEGSWFITGETRKYNRSTGAFDGPSPAMVFNREAGSWGAWELVARYSNLDLNYHAGKAGFATPVDGIRGGEQTIATVGVNWYVNNNLRFMLDVQHVEIDRLSPNAATFATPVGAQIGQEYDTIALRTQFGF
jgi:phosphate-selective porin OprO/OprP